MILLLTSLVGCGPSDEPAEPSDESGGAAEEELPSEYVYEGDEAGEATFDAEAVERALGDFLDVIYELSPEPAIAGYESVMEDADAGCPSWYEVDGNTFWYASCTASSGASYDGYGFYYVYDDEDVFGDGSTWDLVQVAGAATMRDAEGNTFQLGGDAYKGDGWDDTGYKAWYSVVYGSLAWDGPSADGTWLSEDVQPSIVTYGVQYPNGSGDTLSYVYIDGTIAGLSDAVTAVDIDYLIYPDAGFGWPCAAEIGGAISVRDAEGVWWEVVFDVNPETWEIEGECDGCGAVFKGTELVGEACMDPSSLLDWEDSPW